MSNMAMDRRQAPATGESLSNGPSAGPQANLAELSAAGLSRRGFMATLGKAAAAMAAGAAVTNDARAQNSSQGTATQAEPALDPKTTADISCTTLRGSDFLYSSDGTPSPVGAATVHGVYRPSSGTIMQAVARGLHSIREANSGAIPEGAPVRLEVSIGDKLLGQLPINHTAMPKAEEMMQRSQVRAAAQVPDVKAVCDFVAQHTKVWISQTQDEDKKPALLVGFVHADQQRRFDTRVTMKLVVDLPKTDAPPAEAAEKK